MTVDQDSLIRLLTLLGLHSTVENIQPLTGGISAGMSLATLKDAGGKTIRWVIRQPSAATLAMRPHAAVMEYHLLQTMSAQGLPVSKPVFLDENGAVFGSPSLMLEYLEGEIDFSLPAAAGRPKEMGRLLSCIHSVDLSAIKSAQVPALPQSFDSLCGEAPASPDEDLNETSIRQVLKQNWPPAVSNPPVLLHGDFWSGNILWRGCQVSGIIDWEDAWIGDPLLDIAGTRVDLAYTFGLPLAQKFTRAYVSQRKIHLQSLPCWDLVAVLWLIRFINHDLHSWACFYHGYSRGDVTADLIKARINAFSAAAVKRLAIQTSR